MSESAHAVLSSFLEDAIYGVQAYRGMWMSVDSQPTTFRLTFIQVLEWWSKREPNKRMARRVEEVTTVRRVDVKEDSWDNDGLLFEQLFKERLNPQSQY